MTVTTFRSRWGSYNVTRAVLACEPETNSEGTTTQRVAIFETSDVNEDVDRNAVSIVTKTLFLCPDGHTFESSYQGESTTLLRPKARKVYEIYLADGYSLETPLIY